MKFIAQISFTIILAFVLEQILPFWSVAIAAFVVAVIVDHRTLISFLAGFLSIALIWVLSAWIISDMNEGILLEKVVNIFPFNTPVLIIIMATIGGLIGGFAAAAGNSLREIFFHYKKSDNPYKP